jgi:hypothetical protein
MILRPSTVLLLPGICVIPVYIIGAASVDDSSIRCQH